MLENLDGGMDATIAEAFKEISTREAEPVAQPEIASESLATDAVAEAPEEKRVRDEQGRFKATEKIALDASTPVAEPAQQDQYAVAPASWKPAAKALWANLPPEAREEAHRREADFHNGIAQVKPDADFGKSIRSVIEPYRMMIEAEGGTPERAVADLMRTAAIFRVGTQQEKQNALLSIAKTYGVTIPSEGQELQPANNELTSLADQMNRMRQEMQQREQLAQQEQMAQYTTSVDKWMRQADDKGMPLRPFIDNVLNEMQQKLPAIRNQNPEWGVEKVLQEAYDRAIWENPETRATLLRKAEADAKRPEENLRKIADAKKAASVNVTPKGVFATQTPMGTIEDTIRETYRQLNG